MAQIDRLDGLGGDVAIKSPCRVATTANITLSGTQTIDGVAVVADDRVLVKNQTTATENGIYACNANTWVREPDFDGARDIVTGTMVRIISGTVNAASIWEVTNTGTITIGTTSLTFGAALTNNTGQGIADLTHAATVKTTPVGADEFGIWDSVGSLFKRLSLTNLTAYFAALTSTWAISTTGNAATSTTTTTAATATNTVTKTGTGSTYATNTSPTFITPVLGVATGTSLAVTGLVTSSGTAGIGYATGAGGTVTQLTDKITDVSLNKISGQITTHAAALAAATTASFDCNNTTIAAGDVIILNPGTGATQGAYKIDGYCAAGKAKISVRNVTTGSLSEAIVITYVVIKGVVA